MSYINQIPEDLTVLQLEDDCEIIMRISETNEATIARVVSVAEAIGHYNDSSMHEGLFTTPNIGIESCGAYHKGMRTVTTLHNLAGDVVGLSILVPKI